MNGPSSGADAGNRAIAVLLRMGTWIASAILALGMLSGWLEQWGLGVPPLLHAEHLLWAGIVMFVLLPVARVVSTLVTFVRTKDLVYTAFTVFVLLVIGVGVLWELRAH